MQEKREKRFCREIAHRTEVRNRSYHFPNRNSRASRPMCFFPRSDQIDCETGRKKATVPVVLGKRRRREVSSFREIAHRTEVQNRTYHFPSYDSYLVSSDVSARVGIFSSLPSITLLAFFRGLLHDEKKNVLPSLPFLYLVPCLLGDLH